MRLVTTMKIVGAKFSKGTLENGTPYDSTTLFVETDLDSSKGTAVGVCTTEFRWGTSENYKLIEAQKLPVTVTGEIEIVTNGKVSKTVLNSIKLPT